jgi:hypothetical protein
MTPEQEINRIKRDYREHWARLETHPHIQRAIADKDAIKLGEIAARLVYGNTPSKEDLAAGQADYEYYEGIKRRKKLIDERKKSSN